MTEAFDTQDTRDHFAHCVQVLGGATAASRRLGIDERAIRRFINGERPVSPGLLDDTAKVLRQLIADATAAERRIAAILTAQPDAPPA
jgi:DNA-binding transcriptional regulator YdaS (Cro superfamily)